MFSDELQLVPDIHVHADWWGGGRGPGAGVKAALQAEVQTQSLGSPYTDQRVSLPELTLDWFLLPFLVIWKMPETTEL